MTLGKILCTKNEDFSIKDFFSKCDRIRSFLWIWSHSLKKSLMKNFIFFAVHLLREVIELLWKIKFVLCNEFLVSIVIRFFNLVCCSWTTAKSEIWVYWLWISSNDNSVIRNLIFKRGKKYKVALGV